MPAASATTTATAVHVISCVVLVESSIPASQRRSQPLSACARVVRILRSQSFKRCHQPTLPASLCVTAARTGATRSVRAAGRGLSRRPPSRASCARSSDNPAADN